VFYFQGYGNTVDITDASTAKDVFLGTSVYATAISTGDSNTCAILSNQQLLCWGDNEFGMPKKPYSFDYSIMLTIVIIKMCCACVHLLALCFIGEPGIGSNATIGDNETPGSSSTVHLGTGAVVTAVSIGGGLYVQ
jgi:Regulator of chromosome condensation (RCC1) repeat